MKIYDISMMIERDMTVYKHRLERRPLLEHTGTIQSEGVNESTLHVNTHTGTHMDGCFLLCCSFTGLSGQNDLEQIS